RRRVRLSFPTRRSSDLVFRCFAGEQVANLTYDEASDAWLHGRCRAADVWRDEHVFDAPQRAVGGERFGFGDIEGRAQATGCGVLDRKSTRLNSSHVKSS